MVALVALRWCFGLFGGSGGRAPRVCFGREEEEELCSSSSRRVALSLCLLSQSNAHTRLYDRLIVVRFGEHSVLFSAQTPSPHQQELLSSSDSLFLSPFRGSLQPPLSQRHTAPHTDRLSLCRTACQSQRETQRARARAEREQRSKDEAARGASCPASSVAARALSH
jgi:hypothetical protein